MTFGLILVKYEVDPQLASLKLGLPTQLTRTVLFVFEISRLNRRCHVGTPQGCLTFKSIVVLLSVHRQPPVFHRQLQNYWFNLDIAVLLKYTLKIIAEDG